MGEGRWCVGSVRSVMLVCCRPAATSKVNAKKIQKSIHVGHLAASADGQRSRDACGVAYDMALEAALIAGYIYS